MATVNTTWVSPASGTLDKSTGATIDETMTDAWSSDLYHLGGTSGYIGVRATTTGAQSVADNTATALSFPDEQFESSPDGSMHDVSGSPVSNTAVTCRTTGVYRLTAWASFAANVTGVRSLALRLNGATVLAAQSSPAAAVSTTDVTVSTDVLLTASSAYIEAWAYQNSGGALNVSTAALTVVKA